MSAPSLSSTPPTASAGEEMRSGTASSPVTHGSDIVPYWRSGVVLGIALLMTLAYVFNPPLNLEPQAGVVMDLPVILGDYLGKKGEISDAEFYGVPKDTKFARRFYDDSHGHEVECTIVLSGAEESSIHRPEGCLTGQGWTVVGQETIPIPLVSGHPMAGQKLTVERRMMAQDGGIVTVRALYIYWFVGQNVTTSSEINRVLRSNWDRVVHNRAHRWAYVSLFSFISDNLRNDGLGINEDQTQTLMIDFAKQIVPTFQISEMPAQAGN